jgi:hypothetical protein
LKKKQQTANLKKKQNRNQDWMLADELDPYGYDNPRFKF